MGGVLVTFAYFGILASWPWHTANLHVD